MGAAERGSVVHVPGLVVLEVVGAVEAGTANRGGRRSRLVPASCIVHGVVVPNFIKILSGAETTNKCQVAFLLKKGAAVLVSKVRALVVSDASDARALAEVAAVGATALVELAVLLHVHADALVVLVNVALGGAGGDAAASGGGRGVGGVGGALETRLAREEGAGGERREEREENGNQSVL